MRAWGGGNSPRHLVFKVECRHRGRGDTVLPDISISKGSSWLLPGLPGYQNQPKQEGIIWAYSLRGYSLPWR